MTKGDEDDPGNMPESELLSLPVNAIPADPAGTISIQRTENATIVVIRTGRGALFAGLLKSLNSR